MFVGLVLEGFVIYIMCLVGFGFFDYVMVRFDGEIIKIYSCLWFGCLDFGVNGKWIKVWIDVLGVV